jgi:hypothetical protein
MTDKNKQIEATGILILIVTILGIVTWQFIKGAIDVDLLATLYVVSIPFAIGLYVNSAAPSKAQVLGALWGVFISVVSKKLSIPQALKEIEIIIMNAVTLWDQLNTKVKEDAKAATKEDAKPTPTITAPPGA